MCRRNIAFIAMIAISLILCPVGARTSNREQVDVKLTSRGKVYIKVRVTQLRFEDIDEEPIVSEILEILGEKVSKIGYEPISDPLVDADAVLDIAYIESKGGSFSELWGRLGRGTYSGTCIKCKMILISNKTDAVLWVGGIKAKTPESVTVQVSMFGNPEYGLRRTARDEFTKRLNEIEIDLSDWPSVYGGWYLGYFRPKMISETGNTTFSGINFGISSYGFGESIFGGGGGLNFSYSRGNAYTVTNKSLGNEDASFWTIGGHLNGAFLFHLPPLHPIIFAGLCGGYSQINPGKGNWDFGFNYGIEVPISVRKPSYIGGCWNAGFEGFSFGYRRIRWITHSKYKNNSGDKYDAIYRNPDEFFLKIILILW